MAAVAGARRPNWLLRWLVIGSLLVHLAILLQVSGLIQVRTWSKIEVSLAKGQPPARSLPRPRPRPAQPREPRAVNPLAVPKPRPMPATPRKIETPALPDQISQAPAPSQEAAALPTGSLAPPALAATRADLEIYHELLRNRIERHKAYPPEARDRQQEGWVVLRFDIDAKGRLAFVKVVESSGVPSLDLAAGKAVRLAAPFPPPPGGGMSVRITIAFELT